MADLYEYEKLRSKIRKQTETMSGYSLWNKVRASLKITGAWFGSGIPAETYVWCLRSLWAGQEPSLPTSMEWKDTNPDAANDGTAT